MHVDSEFASSEVFAGVDAVTSYSRCCASEVLIIGWIQTGAEILELA